MQVLLENAMPKLIGVDVEPMLSLLRGIFVNGTVQPPADSAVGGSPLVCTRQ